MKKAILAFVPVIHSGYLKFFSDNKGSDFYLIGKDLFLEAESRLSREIRILDESIIAPLIRNIVGEVSILSKDNLPEFISKYDEIVMPDEDVSRYVAEKYLGDKKVIYNRVFLRWDKLISTKELEISPDRKITNNELDRELIAKAFQESEKSGDWWRQIGALVVKDGKIIISGYNKHFPSDFSPYINGDPRNNFDAGIRIDLCTSIHAEASTIATAAKNGIKLAGCDIYVTTFPCPTCARLLAESGIRKVYYSKGYSLLDAEDILKGAGAEIILVQ